MSLLSTGFSVAALLAFSTLQPIVPATYAAGSAILLIGLILAFRRDVPRAHGLDKLICLGPTLYAAPLAVFGAEHLTITRAMTGMVPHWLPWHLFWIVFVGIALIAAALSLAVQRVAALASALLGFMFLGFVVLLDIPGIAHAPTDRFMQAILFRELSFCVCSFALAFTLASDRFRPVLQPLATAARSIVGLAVIFYGVEHFLHPQHVPVIPLELLVPSWIPFHVLGALTVGTALVAAGLAMLANWHARTAATLLGGLIGVVVLLVYLPILAVHPADIAVGMNYFADTLCYGGAILALAGSIPPDRRQPSSAPVHAMAGSRVV